MKTKYLLFIAFFSFSLQSSFAQIRASEFPFWEVSAGIGLLPTFIKDKGEVELTPFFITMDYRLSRKFSLGMYVGHTQVKGDFNLQIDGEGETLRNKFTMLGLRYAIHSDFSDVWDCYGGMNFGYTASRIEVLKGDVEQLKLHHNYKSVSGKMLISAFLGVKYTPENKRYSLFGEVGYGISLLSFGFSQRL